MNSDVNKSSGEKEGKVCTEKETKWESEQQHLLLATHRSNSSVFTKCPLSSDDEWKQSPASWDVLKQTSQDWPTYVSVGELNMIL